MTAGGEASSGWRSTEAGVLWEPEARAAEQIEPDADLPLRGCFITGTDTEVGKTAVSAGLLHGLGHHGLRVAGYKPVAAGAVWCSAASGHGGHWHNEDVEALHAASNIELMRSEVCPCLLEEACAPHLAARLEGGRIEPQVLIAGARRLMSRCDALVVEGVGGFCVPLVEAEDGTDAGSWGADDLASALGLPVIMVVGVRLGCINHSLLTAQAISARGLRLAGWIANRIEPDMTHAQDNIDTLSRTLQLRHGAPLLGVIDYMVPITPPRVASRLDVSALIKLLGLAD